jgi:hypothetical protein
MKKRTKRLIGFGALTIGAIGAGAVLARKRISRTKVFGPVAPLNVWARPGMSVIFRAELMPGRTGVERTFRVVALLPSGRVTLEGVAGEHAEREFEMHDV